MDSNCTVVIIIQCYKLENNHIKSERKNTYCRVEQLNNFRCPFKNQPGVKNTAFLYLVFSNFLWINYFQAKFLKIRVEYFL